MVRKLFTAFLFGCLLTAAPYCHACGFYGSVSYAASYNACYAPQVAFVQAYSYVPAVQYVYQAPAAYTAVQSYAAPCPPAPAVEAYTAPVQVTQQETVILQQYALPRAVSYLTATYGCSAEVALSTLRIIGHHEAVYFHGRADTLFVHEGFSGQRSFFQGRADTTVVREGFRGQRSFFRSDVEVRAPFTDVRVGQRNFFGARAEARASRPHNVFIKSVTRTRTRLQ